MLEADPVLGPVVATYPADRARLLLPAGVVVGAVAVVLNYTLATIPDWGPLLTVGLMSLVSLVAGWWVLHWWNREVILYDNGFSYREGGREVLFHYAEIKSVRERAEVFAYFGGLFRRTVYRLTLITVQDQQIILGNLYRRAPQLGEQLTRHVYREIEPAIRDRLARGEWVAFTETLRLSREGLHESGRVLPWPDYSSYQLQGGGLRVLTRSGETWVSLPLDAVDNIHLLVALLR